MHYVRCYLCGRDDAKLLYKKSHAPGPVVRCKHCTLICVNPIHIDIDAIYDINHDSSINQCKKGGEKKTYRDQYYRRRDFTQRLIKAGRFLKTKHPRLLDVGCNIGTLLTAAKDLGFKVSGVEPRHSLSSYAGGKYNLDIFTGTREQARYPDEHFDVVTLFHVLEHMQRPLETLSEIRRILKKDGLLILEVPNIDSLPIKIFRRMWRIFIKGHLIYFSPYTLKAMLEKSGFVVLSTKYLGRTMSIEYMITQAIKKMQPCSNYLQNSL